jgi:hypothetical protein
MEDVTAAVKPQEEEEEEGVVVECGVAIVVEGAGTEGKLKTGEEGKEEDE